MSDKTMPDRIWVTGEHSLWPTFRSFTASDLDHSNDDGTSDYQEYVRADLVPAPAVPDDVAMHPQERAIARATIEAQAAKLARLTDALQNVMGHIDTPIGRRRLNISDPHPEWLTEARSLLDAHTAEQPAPDAVAEAAERVARYLNRRKKSRSDDPEDIHGYDVSPEGGFPLRASDLQTLVNLAKGSRP